MITLVRYAIAKSPFGAGQSAFVSPHRALGPRGGIVRFELRTKAYISALCSLGKKELLFIYHLQKLIAESNKCKQKGLDSQSFDNGVACLSVSSFNHQLRSDHCITEPAKTKYGNKNIFGCPCKDSFKCIPKVVTEEDGKTIMKNFSCKKGD
ncbi:prokineticin domain-containing protein [Trichonephila inaurata madagascariensis]|uniref:Prokineticin domain-containing protein n=1 Tax=Trichonephila inaurata madagascariensis TaxID=2747483 RepID=A0A8X6YJ31_9ARAC|nr:prokineticin domain-containing protein [Trichonephila inaurata madagascariensis]